VQVVVKGFLSGELILDELWAPDASIHSLLLAVQDKVKLSPPVYDEESGAEPVLIDGHVSAKGVGKGRSAVVSRARSSSSSR